MKKLESTQAIRGVALLFVIFAHLLKIEQKYSALPFLPEWTFSGISGVDLFFLISGFIMVSVTRGAFQNTNKISEFVYLRLTRIYPLYWIYASLILIMLFINPNWVNHGKTGGILASFFLIPQGRIPLVAVCWTLSYEIYFYMVFALLMFLPEQFLARALGIWAGIIMLLEWLITPDSPVVSMLINPLTFEFIAGALLAILYNKFNLTNGINKYALLAIFITSLIVIIINHELFVYLHHRQPKHLARVLILGIPSAIALYSLLQAERAGLAMSKGLVTLGNASYSIYLSHVLVLSALGRVFFRPSFGLFANTVVLVLLVACVLIIGLLSYEWLEKPMLRWFRVKQPLIPRLKAVPG